MSTDLQLKGDSRRRQLEASKAYAETHGLELADEAQLEDIGVSAFKGANVKEGALGRFLHAVKDGSIPPGSYLLVESLDRISREQLLPAHTLFLSIIQAGINLVTLMDQRLYRAGQTNLVDLILSLVTMSRAHEESQMKSLRVGAAWKNKRNQAASGKPMTVWCPAWLRLSADRTSYDIIPDRADVVRGIFSDASQGMGMFSIASRLNRSAVPTFSKSNGWHQSYVAKILASRAVLGEFQPGTRVDGVRVPQGEPIKDYYPPIVTEELFYQAQIGKKQRKVSGAGRKGAAFTNLFSGIATCAYCHSQVTFENKGTGKKGGTYLICDSSRRQLGCNATRWRYQDFEASFLAFVQEIDLETVMNSTADAERRKRLQGEVIAIQGELASISDRMNKTYEVIDAGGPAEFLAGKLADLNQRKVELNQTLLAKLEEQNDAETRETRIYQSKEEIKRLVAQLQGLPTDDLFKLRAQIASRLKILVATVLVAPLGKQPWLHARHADHARRFFAVGFHDAAARAVFPKYGDPLQFDQQVIARDDNVTFIDSEGETSPSQ